MWPGCCEVVGEEGFMNREFKSQSLVGDVSLKLGVRTPIFEV
jgi:hypothetical protein